MQPLFRFACSAEAFEFDRDGTADLGRGWVWRFLDGRGSAVALLGPSDQHFSLLLLFGKAICSEPRDLWMRCAASVMRYVSDTCLGILPLAERGFAHVCPKTLLLEELVPLQHV